MAAPTTLCGSESWVLAKKDWSHSQTGEIKFIKSVIECTKHDQIGINLIGQKLNIYNINNKI